MFVPEGAFIVYPKELVHEMLGHSHPGSTRKTMTRYSPGMVIGWPVDEVQEALKHQNPDRSWPRTPGARTRGPEATTEE